MAVVFILLGITGVYCYITVKREENSRKIPDPDEAASSAHSTLRRFELIERNNNLEELITTTLENSRQND